jgi:hypothetical protein
MKGRSSKRRAEGGGEVDEDFEGGAAGVEAGDVLGVEVEKGEDFAAVEVEALADAGFVGVVGAAVALAAVEEAIDEHRFVVAGEVDGAEDACVGADKVGLAGGAGEAVEEEDLVGGVVVAGGDAGLDVVVPEADDEVVGEELALLEDGVDLAAEGGVGGDGAEGLAGVEVDEVGEGGEGAGEGAFAGAGEAEEDDGGPDHGGIVCWFTAETQRTRRSLTGDKSARTCVGLAFGSNVRHRTLNIQLQAEGERRRGAA